jgi:hypothetical protein
MLAQIGALAAERKEKSGVSNGVIGPGLRLDPADLFGDILGIFEYLQVIIWTQRPNEPSKPPYCG